MKITVNTVQIEFLKKIISLRKKGFTAPYTRIEKIIKTGYYYDNLNSYHIPPDNVGTNDATTLNKFGKEYLKFIKK